MKLLLLLSSVFSFTLITNPVFSQVEDTTHVHNHNTPDTFYIIHENVPKTKLLGNSWYAGAAYNRSACTEYSANIGRTYGTTFASGGGFNLSMKTWGIGYSYFYTNEYNSQSISAFAEISNFFLPPGTVRLDYFYDFENNSNYVRPSVGLSLFAIDILYGYSFLLNGEENLFKHVFTLRFKYFINNKNWQKDYPNSC